MLDFCSVISEEESGLELDELAENLGI